VAALALVQGVILNATLVPGPYDWLGLFHIFRAISVRPGFWALCLLVWLAGVRNAPLGHHLFSPIRLKPLGIWLGLSLAGMVSVLVRPDLLGAGSMLDALCFALLLPGLILHLTSAPGPWRNRLREAGRLVTAAGLSLLAFTIVGFGYTMTKGILFINTEPVDEVLKRVDLWLLGAGLYQHLAAFRISHPLLTRGLDLAYIGLMPQLWWSVFYFYGAKDIRNGRPYILALLFIYLFGSLAYFVLPSLGPIFHDRVLFEDLRRLAPDSANVSSYLLQQTGMTRAGRAHPIAPFGFIAAMPSLHVGQALIMLLAMQRSALMSVLNLIMLLLTVAATTVLGWHYFTDDIVGALLGLGCWFLGRKIASWDLVSKTVLNTNS
jgi:hypothetical protein